MATGSADATAEGGTDSAKISAYAAGALGLLLTVGALAVLGGRAAFSVAIGAGIAVGNLVAMSAIIRALVRGSEDADAKADANANADADAKADANADAEADAKADADAKAEAGEAVDHRAEGRRGGAAWGGFALLKIVVLFGGIWLLLTRGWVDPIPLVVGYGVLPLGIAASSVLSSLAPRKVRRRPRTK
jgi:hypothetical protein